MVKLGEVAYNINILISTCYGSYFKPGVSAATKTMKTQTYNTVQKSQVIHHFSIICFKQLDPLVIFKVVLTDVSLGFIKFFFF